MDVGELQRHAGCQHGGADPERRRRRPDNPPPQLTACSQREWCPHAPHDRKRDPTRTIEIRTDSAHRACRVTPPRRAPSRRSREPRVGETRFDTEPERQRAANGWETSLSTRSNELVACATIPLWGATCGRARSDAHVDGEVAVMYRTRRG